VRDVVVATHACYSASGVFRAQGAVGKHRDDRTRCSASVIATQYPEVHCGATCRGPIVVS